MPRGVRWTLLGHSGPLGPWGLMDPIGPSPPILGPSRDPSFAYRGRPLSDLSTGTKRPQRLVGIYVFGPNGPGGSLGPLFLSL